MEARFGDHRWWLKLESNLGTVSPVRSLQVRQLHVNTPKQMVSAGNDHRPRSQ